MSLDKSWWQDPEQILPRKESLDAGDTLELLWSFSGLLDAEQLFFFLLKGTEYEHLKNQISNLKAMSLAWVPDDVRMAVETVLLQMKDPDNDLEELRSFMHTSEQGFEMPPTERAVFDALKKRLSESSFFRRTRSLKRPQKESPDGDHQPSS